MNYLGKQRGIKPYKFRIALQVIRVIRVICEICGLISLIFLCFQIIYFTETNKRGDFTTFLQSHYDISSHTHSLTRYGYSSEPAAPSELLLKLTVEDTTPFSPLKIETK